MRVFKVRWLKLQEDWHRIPNLITQYICIISYKGCFSEHGVKVCLCLGLYVDVMIL